MGALRAALLRLNVGIIVGIILGSIVLLAVIALLKPVVMGSFAQQWGRAAADIAGKSSSAVLALYGVIPSLLVAVNATYAVWLARGRPVVQVHIAYAVCLITVLAVVDGLLAWLAAALLGHGGALMGIVVVHIGALVGLVVGYWWLFRHMAQSTRPAEPCGPSDAG